jgi:hypothetical protein
LVEDGKAFGNLSQSLFKIWPCLRTYPNDEAIWMVRFILETEVKSELCLAILELELSLKAIMKPGKSRQRIHSK